jgi:hypothetical protein
MCQRQMEAAGADGADGGIGGRAMHQKQIEAPEVDRVDEDVRGGQSRWISSELLCLCQ